MRGDELMSVDMLLIDRKSVLIINLAPVLKTILDGSRSKQSFRFADTPVSLLFEEVPERIKLYPQGAVSVSRLRGVDIFW
ncbi:unnamed protein product [Brassica oleracea var. botrytis]|uniref:Uncharacterized protein n=1 Tax=Brassica oleracea TaxID=3712 RepID=A0A3P6EAF5_BRAOL|nr:unnamed protein product [Brassica oleracea]